MEIQEHGADNDTSLHQSNHRNLVDGQRAGVPFNVVINDLHFAVDSDGVQNSEQVIPEQESDIIFG